MRGRALVGADIWFYLLQFACFSRNRADLQHLLPNICYKTHSGAIDAADEPIIDANAVS